MEMMCSGGWMVTGSECITKQSTYFRTVRELGLLKCAYKWICDPLFDDFTSLSHEFEVRGNYHSGNLNLCGIPSSENYSINRFTNTHDLMKKMAASNTLKKIIRMGRNYFILTQYLKSSHFMLWVKNVKFGMIIRIRQSKERMLNKIMYISLLAARRWQVSRTLREWRHNIPKPFFEYVREELAIILNKNQSLNRFENLLLAGKRIGEVFFTEVVTNCLRSIKDTVCNGHKFRILLGHKLLLEANNIDYAVIRNYYRRYSKMTKWWKKHNIKMRDPENIESLVGTVWKTAQKQHSNHVQNGRHLELLYWLRSDLPPIQIKNILQVATEMEILMPHYEMMVLSRMGVCDTPTVDYSVFKEDSPDKLFEVRVAENCTHSFYKIGKREDSTAAELVKIRSGIIDCFNGSVLAQETVIMFRKFVLKNFACKRYVVNWRKKLTPEGVMDRHLISEFGLDKTYVGNGLNEECDFMQYCSQYGADTDNAGWIYNFRDTHAESLGGRSREVLFYREGRLRLLLATDMAMFLDTINPLMHAHRLTRRRF